MNKLLDQADIPSGVKPSIILQRMRHLVSTDLKNDEILSTTTTTN